MFETQFVWYTPAEKLPEPQHDIKTSEAWVSLEFVLAAILSEAKDDYVLAEAAVEFGETGTIISWRFMTGTVIQPEEVIAWAYWPTYIPKLDQIIKENRYAQENSL